MLLVYGPRSATYDFGPGHPLTPRRFGPGIDLLRAVGAEPGLAPEPAPDAELAWCHDAALHRGRQAVLGRAVRRPAGRDRRGRRRPAVRRDARGGGDGRRRLDPGHGGDPARRRRARLPPGRRAPPRDAGRASGFCIYDDPALAIARARRDGLRVLYVDLDVHHGDGVQAIHWDDPGVLTVSIHESGLYLFPGSGFVDEVGEGVAAGTAVNVPLGRRDRRRRRGWTRCELLLPELAAAFGPGRRRQPARRRLARLGSARPPAHHDDRDGRGGAARRRDRASVCRRPLARDRRRRLRRLSGRAADVVPRLAGRRASRGPGRDPGRLARALGDEGARYGQAPLPETFDDAPNAGWAVDCAQTAAEAPRPRRPARPPRPRAAAAPRGARPRLVGPAAPRPRRHRAALAGGRTAPRGAPTSSTSSSASWDGLALAPGSSRRPTPVGPRPSRPRSATAARRAAAAVVGRHDRRRRRRRPDGELLALGVAPAHRRRGLAGGAPGGESRDPGRGDGGGARPRRSARSSRAHAVARRLLERRRGFRVDESARSVRDPADDASRHATCVDVRLSEAISTCGCRHRGGCPICAVRARSERAMLDTIIAERVLDIPFRESLERTQGFCRRHVAELVLADRRGPGGILGSSILYGAMLDRRLEALRGALGRGAARCGRGWRAARKRPPCLACNQGASAVETALGRLVERARTRPGRRRWRRPRSASTTSSPLGRRGRRGLRADRPAPARAASSACARASRASWTTRRTIAGT